jgi:hypothetical protein
MDHPTGNLRAAHSTTVAVQARILHSSDAGRSGIDG